MLFTVYTYVGRAILDPVCRRRTNGRIFIPHVGDRFLPFWEMRELNLGVYWSVQSRREDTDLPTPYILPKEENTRRGTGYGMMSSNMKIDQGTTNKQCFSQRGSLTLGVSRQESSLRGQILKVL